MSDDYKREDSHKKKQTPSSWRNPDGTHSDVRLEKKGAAPKPKAGRRKKTEVRGLHPSGYEEVLVHRPKDLDSIEEGQAARIASKVGGRKKEQMLEKAEEMDIKVLNAGDEE